jgi:Flp pilus assembly protein TadD
MRPNFHSAYNNIAVCYGNLDRLAEAEEALRKCIEIKPSDFYAMNNLAVTYMRRKDYAGALPMAELAVKTEPGYVNGRITYGSVLAMTGNLDAAESQFREALRLEPGNRSAQENLRRLAQQRGN